MCSCSERRDNPVSPPFHSFILCLLDRFAVAVPIIGALLVTAVCITIAVSIDVATVNTGVAAVTAIVAINANAHCQT